MPAAARHLTVTGYQGDKPKRQRFKRYPIGLFHKDIAKMQTAKGKLYRNHPAGAALLVVGESLRTSLQSHVRTSVSIMAQVTILARPERRHRWSERQREQIFVEAFQSGARVCDVAQRHDVARGLIYEWRRAKRCQADPAFVPAVLMDERPEPVREPVVAAIFDLPDGGRLKIFVSASPALAAAALKAIDDLVRCAGVDCDGPH